MSMTVIEVRNDLLSKLGVEVAATATALTLQDVVVAINGAGQMLQAAGQVYFTKERLSVGVYAGTSIYPIARNIQSIIGNALLDGDKPLRCLESEGQYNQYNRIFCGGTTYGPGHGVPDAYWVDYAKQGDSGDICDINLWIAPTPEDPGTITIDVVNDWVEYTVDDLDSTEELPVAQNYTESIFLPIARLLVTRSSQFSRPDIMDQINADAQRAFARLGVSGGFPNEEQPYPPRKTEG